MSTTDELRENQKHQWNAAATGWDTWAHWYDANFRPLTNWLCQAIALGPGDSVLDIACGTGQPALAAADRVRPDGKVVAIDISPRMLAVTERRAKEAGLDNIELHEMDAENLEFADHAFDAITCACGLMFCPNPMRAVAEMHRVLKPGGRFALAVWDEPAKNPFFTTIGQSFGRFLPAPPGDPKAPGGFRLAPPGELEAVIRAGGFSAFAIESRPMRLECNSVAEYWQIFIDFAGALQARLSTLSETDVSRLKEDVRGAAEPYMEDGRLRLAATPLCASGRK